MHRLETEFLMPSHILVIDDDQSILEMFQSILETEGYRVSLAKIVFEEVYEVEQRHPDLIILDFKIGSHHEGWLLLQKLKMYRPTKDIPVFLCAAALTEVREQEETLRQKGIPVLYKPFDIDELLHVIHQCLPLKS